MFTPAGGGEGWGGPFWPDALVACEAAVALELGVSLAIDLSRGLSLATETQFVDSSTAMDTVTPLLLAKATSASTSAGASVPPGRRRARRRRRRRGLVLALVALAVELAREELLGLVDDGALAGGRAGGRSDLRGNKRGSRRRRRARNGALATLTRTIISVRPGRIGRNPREGGAGGGAAGEAEVRPSWSLLLDPRVTTRAVAARLRVVVLVGWDDIL